MTPRPDSISSILEQATRDGGVYVPRVFTRMTKDHTAAMVLSQILYWSDRTSDPEGWFYKTEEDWQEELGLSYFQVARATNTLEAFGIEKTRRRVKGAVCMHFRVNWPSFEESILKFLEIQETRNSRNSKIENTASGSDFEVSRNSRNLNPDFQETSKSINKETKTTNKDYMHDPSDARTSASPEGEQASQQELPIDSPDQPTQPKQPKARKPKEPKDPSEHRKLMDAYQEALGYQIPNGGQEGIAAKWLLEHSYTIAQIIACYQHLKRDPYWTDRHVSLQLVKREIGAFVQAHKQAQARASPPVRASPYTNGAMSAQETTKYMQSLMNGATYDPGTAE